jgi:hypothetical protein
MRGPTLFLLLVAVLMLPSCKTTNPSSTVLSSKNVAESTEQEKSSIEAKTGDFSNAGCFKVTSAESELTSQDAKRLIQDTKTICISELISGSNPDKMIVELKAESNKILATYRFKQAVPARCPGCYIFSASKDGHATFSETAVTTLAKLGLNLAKYDGKISFMMLRELSDTAPMPTQK